MHYILIIGILSMPFPTYEDCLVEQAVRGGSCIAKSYGTAKVNEPLIIPPIVPTPPLNEKPVGVSYRTREQVIEESARTSSVENKQAFVEGFKEEIKKPEAIEEDI